MSDDPEPRLSIGGNQPPAPLTAAEIAAYLDDAHSPLTQRRDQLVQALHAFAAKYPSIDSEHVAAAATENIAMARKALKMWEERRVEAKQPFLFGGRAVDGWFTALRDDLTSALAGVEQAATAYAVQIETQRRAAAQAEAERQQRIADEKAAELAQASDAMRDRAYDKAIAAAAAAEDAQRLAQARAAEHSRTTGSYGSVSSLRERWVCEIVNPLLVPSEFMVPDQPALNRAVAAGVREIAGCRIYLDKRLQTR